MTTDAHISQHLHEDAGVEITVDPDLLPADIAKAVVNEWYRAWSNANPGLHVALSAVWISRFGGFAVVTMESSRLGDVSIATASLLSYLEQSKWTRHE